MVRSLISALSGAETVMDVQFDKSSFRSTDIFLKVASIEIDDIASSYQAYKAK